MEKEWGKQDSFGSHAHNKARKGQTEQWKDPFGGGGSLFFRNFLFGGVAMASQPHHPPSKQRLLELTAARLFPDRWNLAETNWFFAPMIRLPQMPASLWGMFWFLITLQTNLVDIQSVRPFSHLLCF